MSNGTNLVTKLISNYNKVGATGSESTMEINKVMDDIKKSETNEKWSQKYKKSIDCNNPKGFSQRAHCQGKKKKSENKEATGSGSSGGYVGPLFGENLNEAERTILAKLRDIAKKHAYDDSKDTTSKEKIEKIYQKLKKQYAMGVKVETEHESADPKLIALDHLEEDPNYYTKLKKVEANEATTTSSSGQYSSPSFLAKSMSSKNWRGKSKTQIPGGKFVEVKKKCKKYPYCNQGDINALKLTESEVYSKMLDKFSKEYNLPKSVISKIINESESKKN